MLSLIVLSVFYAGGHKLALCAECSYSERPYAERRGAAGIVDDNKNKFTLFCSFNDKMKVYCRLQIWTLLSLKRY